MRTLLLIDDDEFLREAVAETLVESEDFEVLEAGTAAEGEKRFSESHIDMLIVDVGLPDMDGRDLCAKLREQGVTVPILMLTGELGEANEIKGLNSGANDYITKPVNTNILLARIRTQFRQFEQASDTNFPVVDAIFFPGRKQFVKADQSAIKLTEKEVGILKLLCLAEGRHASRQDLLSQVWGYNNSVSTHTLETHIYRLRQKIETDPQNPVFLVTQDGGYKLGDPV